ncbi:MAG: M20/M25/M40 family metallo-hydrolase [Candidatus Zixiibacteriota bacterium]
MKTLPVLLTIAILTSSIAAADDLGLVTIKNYYQAEVTRGILDPAYTRVEDRFLASVNAQQADLLTQAGIEFEIVMRDVDASATYLMFPPRKPDMAPSNIPESVDIGMGLKVSPYNSEIALSQTGRGKWKAVPLTELSVEYYYVSKAVTDLLMYLDSYPSDTLVDLVSQDSIYEFDTHLEDFETRYIWTTQIDAARDWMVQKFLDWGYTDVTTPEFYYGGDRHYNVMAVKPGYAEPDKVIVVGGHYDSITFGVDPGPYVYAPGADDNASGTTTMLELARILANVPLRKTVVFMAFSAEEVGLYGSAAAARTFYENGTNLEVMFNYDMVGYDPYNEYNIDLAGGENLAYRQISAQAATRLTSLTPITGAMGTSSDHYSFYRYGFEIVDAIESNFNYDGWHTNLDVSERMNFAYFTEVVKMAIASVGIVANSVHATDIEEVVDQGDGHSLEVFWTDCDPAYTYTLHYGTVSGSYPYSISIPTDVCSWVVDGLITGTAYYFAVEGETEGAYPASFLLEGSGVPLIIPRIPQGISLNIGIRQIGLNWNSNREADLSHYRLYRDDGSGAVLYQDNLTDTVYVDTGVEALTTYTYYLTAVDHDLNESGPSAQVSGMAYTFDQGVLLVDETYDDWVLPSQATQEAYFDSIFGATTYAIDTVAGTTDTLSRQKAGPYSSIFWLDDDSGNNDARYSEPTLEWYASNQTSIFIAGWKTVTSWVDSPVDTDHLLYAEFGVAAHSINTQNDFVGAVGQNGWPSLSMDTDNTWAGKMPYMSVLTPRAGVEVIYTFDSFTDNPAFEGLPCGLLYETAHGKRIVLSFPLYFLTPASSEAVIAMAVNVLGEGLGYVPCDIDGSGVVDPLDLGYMVDYVWKSGAAPPNLNAADVDGNCEIDPLDITYIVNYFYKGGTEPLPGCVY